MEYTKSFSSLSRNDSDSAGGKGASLGEMTQAGIPVPPGFVILAQTFDYFIHKTGLIEEIDAALEKVDHKVMHTVDSASETIEALIKKQEVPEDIKSEIAEQFTKLDSEFVAVRSSATAEDGAENAWAGQLESYLNTTEETLFENIKNCWASLFTPRAIFYRFEKGLETTHISVAVVVQKMVNSEKSGIAFSVHPVTEDYNQIIIEAGFGLGESIVSGAVTPDSYVVEKEPRKIIDIVVNNQTRALYRKEGGGNEWRELFPEVAGSQALSEKEIKEFADVVMTIEKHYGFPCDIEWAFEDGTFYITQSRPITTLTGKNVDETVKENKPFDIIETLSQRDWHFIHKRMRSPFYTGLLWSGTAKHKNDSIPFPYEVDTIIYLDTHIAVDNDSWEKLRVLLHEELQKNPNILFDLLHESYKMDEGIVAWMKAENARAADMSAARILASFWQEYTNHIERFGSYVLLPLFIEPDMEQKLKDAIVDKFGIEKLDEVFQLLTTPIRPGAAQEEELGLLDLAVAKKAGKDIRNQLEKHLENFAWITNNSFIGKFMTLDELHSRIDHLISEGSVEEKRSAYLAKINDFKQKFEVCRDQFLNLDIRSLIDTLQESIYFRSWRTERYYRNAYFIQDIIQKSAKVLGIKNMNDFFYFSVEEIIHALKTGEPLLMQEIEARRKGYMGVTYQGEMYFFSGVDLERAKQKISLTGHQGNTDTIKGQPAFAGKVSGPACVVISKSDLSKVKSGDILVSPSTTVDYVPALKKVVGIVTEEGGVLSHASVISRELHIPCVIGTKIATQVIKDGDLVELDAEKGIVKILEKGSSTNLGLHKEDYILTFWVKGVNVLVTDISKDMYVDLDALYILDEGVFKQYFRKEAFDRALDAGVEFYSNKTVFDSYEKDLKQQCKATQHFFEKEIQGKESLSKETVKTFFKQVVSICSGYIKMDFEYTDKAFTLRNQNEIIDQNLKVVSKFKDELRAFLNTVLFEKDGYLGQLAYILHTQFKLPAETIENLTQREILGLFDGYLFENKNLKDRSQFFVAVNGITGEEYREGKDAQDIAKYFRDEIDEGAVIKGQTASPGHITGKVKIISVDYSDFSKITKEMEKMEQGDILVAETTAPELLVACKKAGAIVTDMGGLMSHAAIVSREFGIPCIVGTQNASRILKDGDMVEVDANTGIVAIIR